MRHALHHYAWLLRRFRGALFLYVALWSAVAFVQWGTAWGTKTDDYALMSHWLLLAVGGVVWLSALQQDPLPGTAAFWRTRPVRGPSLWASQAAFLLTGIAGPPLACWLLNGLLLDNTATQWSAGLWDTALIVCPLLAVAGVASFAGRSFGLAVATFLGGVAWMISIWFTLRAGAMSAHVGRPGVPDLLESAMWLWMLYPAACCVVAWSFSFKAGRIMPRGVSLILALIIGPTAISYLLPRQVREQPAQLSLHPSGVAIPGAYDFGGIQFSGMPQGQWPLLSESALRTPDGNRAGGVIGTETITSLPAAAFASLLPAGTRWYHSLPNRRPQEWHPRETPPEIWSVLQGHVRGALVAPDVLLSLPLQGGAAHAANGTRVHLRGVHVSGHELVLAADVFLAASLGQTVRSRLTTLSGSVDAVLLPVLLPVLHFPSAGFAVILEQTERETFRTWQTDAVQVELRTAVPLAESLLGADWSPATLDGARFLVCHLRPAGEFVALPSAESPAP